jgi:hypothetical protein
MSGIGGAGQDKRFELLIQGGIGILGFVIFDQGPNPGPPPVLNARFLAQNLTWQPQPTNLDTTSPWLTQLTNPPVRTLVVTNNTGGLISPDLKVWRSGSGGVALEPCPGFQFPKNPSAFVFEADGPTPNGCRGRIRTPQGGYFKLGPGGLVNALDKTDATVFFFYFRGL